MKQAILFLAVGFTLARGGVSVAQETAPPVQARQPETEALGGNGTGASNVSLSGNARARTWCDAEYLLWFLQGAPLPVPIATTVAGQTAVPAAPANAGGLGVAGTQVLSPDRLNAGAFSGMRFAAGRWLDSDNSFGVELGGYLLPSQTASFAARSSIQDGPALLVPFAVARVSPPSPNALPVGGKGQASGSIAADNRTELWGLRADSLLEVLRDDRRRVSLLAGFRYLNLADELQMGIETVAATGAKLEFHDSFRTQNQFWGGALGVRGQFDFGRFFADLNAGVGLGAMQESVDIAGQTKFSSAKASFDGAGGFFAQPTNSGRRSSDAFAVMPEIGARFGVKVTNTFHAYCGYDFLYVSNVVRPGNQIDPHLNLSQTFGRPLVGTAAPVPLINSTDMTIHGVSFGVSLRF